MGLAGLGGARRSLKFTKICNFSVFAESVSFLLRVSLVFAENVSMYARIC
jgi:hypothetical protein